MASKSTYKLMMRAVDKLHVQGKCRSKKMVRSNMVASVALEDLLFKTQFFFRNRLSSNLSRQGLTLQPWFLVVPTHKPCMRKFQSADWIEDPQKNAGMMSHNLMRMYWLTKGR